MKKALLLVILPLCSCVALAQGGEKLVTVVPAETYELLANPGMGWQTFHTTSKEDSNLPPWLPSTVAYIRWGWKELEPDPGVLNFRQIDEAIHKCRLAGQKLAFRVMCCSPSPTEPYHPAWLSSLPKGVALCDYQGRTVPVANLNNPEVLKRHLDFLKRLGDRYNAHPYVDHVDIGSVGWWGEWHMCESACSLPPVADRIKVIDAYLTYFSSTPLLMLVAGEDCLAYAARRGAGWRADCLGDLGMFTSRWSHMRHGYPEMLAQARAADCWKDAPVAFESCGDLRDWVRRGYSLRYIFNYALALHATYLNNKSAPLPQEAAVRLEIERFLRRLGYRFVLKELVHPLQLTRGREFVLRMKWQNVGSAPCYKPYRIAYRLSSADGTASFVLRGNIQVHRWLPGWVAVFSPEFFASPPDLPNGDISSAVERLVCPEGLPAGHYRLSLAIVGDDNIPQVRLAIAGKTPDNWYMVGEVDVKD